MGSSRTRDSVVPKLLDRELMRPEGTTGNLGMNGARVFDSLYVYEHNEEKLKGAEFVFLNVDEWHLSTGADVLNPVYDMNGPLSERLRFPKDQRTRMVLDGIFSMRVKFSLVGSALFRKSKPWRPLDANNQAQYSTVPVKEEYLAIRMNQFYNKFEISDVMLEHIKALALRVKANGGKFVLLQMPNRNAYQKLVDQSYGKEFIQQRRALEALARTIQVPFYAYNRPEEIGLTDSDYGDYGHVTPEGAVKVTKFMSGLIRKLKPE